MRNALVSRMAQALGFVPKEAVPRALESLNERTWFNLRGRPETDFQRDIRWTHDGVMANATVYACISLIASDLGKVRLKLVEKVGEVWKDADVPAFSPVIRKPNPYQTRQQFIEMWATSKLAKGNTYALKERNRSQVVSALHIIDPNLCTPLVSESGAVFYALQPDRLAKIPDYADETNGQLVVPASEVIHDRMVCLFHPLVGVSPLFACGLAASHGLAIQANQTRFFRNGSRPGVVLSAPNQISDATAARVQAYWEAEFSGDNVGRVAVLGDGLKPEALAVNPDVAQLVEQLKLSAEMICSTFHVPGFKVGVGATPTYQNAAVLNQVYYTDCLQKFTEAIEALLDEGLGLTTRTDTGKQYGVMFDLDDLFKMDPSTFTGMLKEQVGAGIAKLDEARAKLNLPPMEGGNTAYLQVQNYSVGALARRDAREDPFAPATAPAADPPADPPPEPDQDDESPEASAKIAAALMFKALHA